MGSCAMVDVSNRGLKKESYGRDREVHTLRTYVASIRYEGYCMKVEW